MASHQETCLISMELKVLLVEVVEVVEVQKSVTDRKG